MTTHSTNDAAASAPLPGSTRERRHCPHCSHLEGNAHAFFCPGRKVDGRWVGGHKAVDNAVTRAGDALLPFVEAIKGIEAKVKICAYCGDVTLRSSGICSGCINKITRPATEESNNQSLP